MESFHITKILSNTRACKIFMCPQRSVDILLVLFNLTFELLTIGKLKTNIPQFKYNIFYQDIHNHVFFFFLLFFWIGSVWLTKLKQYRVQIGSKQTYPNKRKRTGQDRLNNSLTKVFEHTYIQACTHTLKLRAY